MTTKELIDLMKLNAPGWNRTGDKSLIQMLEEAQNILYEQETYGSLAFKADGTLPNLATTALTQTYNINATTLGLASGTKLYRVGAVLVKQPYSNALATTFQIDYSQLINLELPQKEIVIGGIAYQILHHVNTVDEVDTSAPIVNFSINPGTTTNDYFIMAYKKATALTAESVQPDIPTRLHMTHLLPTAMKLVEAHQNGSWIESLSLIGREFMPGVRKHMNKGAQGELHIIGRYEE